MMKKPLKYTVIFGGGAIRGIAYLGALKALHEFDVEVDTLAGSSVGAIFAGLMAVGYQENELKDLFLNVNFDLFRDIHFGLGKEFAISKGEVFLDWLRELIERKYYGENYKKGSNEPVKFKDIEKELVVITTDLTNFKCKEFSKSKTPDFEVAKAIRISSTMPGLMPPYKYENSELVDGDLQKSWPLWKLSETLNKEENRILEFRLEGDYAGKGMNAINFINTVYSCVTSVATKFIVESYGKKDKYDYIILNTGEVVIVDFNLQKEKREHIIQIGYEQTKKYFKDVLLDKKKNLLEQYEMIYKHALTLEKFLKKRKISQMKEEIGMLYLDLHEANKYIDEKIFDDVNDFKDVFFNHLSEPNLFGMYSKANLAIVETALTILKDKLELKLEDIKEFLSDNMFV